MIPTQVTGPATSVDWKTILSEFQTHDIAVISDRITSQGNRSVLVNADDATLTSIIQRYDLFEFKPSATFPVGY